MISLRNAQVFDDGDLVGFRIYPVDYTTLPDGRKRWAPKDFDWVTRDSVWLYRYMRSPTAEAELMQAFPCVQQDVRPVVFEKPPQFKLLWTDSGNGAAVCLNGEPWAFVDEETQRGYSRGILKAANGTGLGKPWEQDLFEKIFLK